MVNFLKGLAQFDRKYAISLIIGIIIGGFSIYAMFFFERKPEVNYQILSNSNVIDVHTDLSKLDIIYDGLSIKKSGQKLRIVTLRVINDGRKGIIPDEYAENEPLGVKIENGKIIEKPELLTTSNSYLKRNLSFKYQHAANIVEFSKVIFDPKESFTFKLLILYENETTPSLKAVGTVAGMDTPEIININEKVEEEFLVWRVIKAVLAFIGKGFALLFGFSIMLLILASPFIIISEYRTKKKRNRAIEFFKSTDAYDENFGDINDFLIDTYKDFGKSRLKELKGILDDEEKIRTLMPVVIKTNSLDPNFFGKIDLNLDSRNKKFTAKYVDDLIDLELLIENGFINIDNDAYLINERPKNILSSFIKFVDK